MDDNTYSVNLTGREIWWLKHLANQELMRLQDITLEEGKSIEEAEKYKRWGPISGAFNNLINIGPHNKVKEPPEQ